MFLVTSGTGM